MSISRVRLKFNGSWYTLTYNSSTGLYTGTITPTSTSTSLSGGYYPLEIEATNSSGVVATATAAQVPDLRLVVRDTTAPTLSVTSPSNNLVTASSSVTVSGTVSDVSGIASLTVNGTSTSVSSSGSFSRSVSLSSGTNTITVRATDGAGNVATVTRTVKRATSGPSLTISSPSNGAVIRATTVTVSGTVSDSVSTVSSVKVNGTTASRSGSSWSATISLSEGSNTISVVAQNAVGLSTTKSITVSRDMGGPTITWTSPANGLVTAASSITVSGKATDTHGVQSVTVNGTTVTVASDGSFSRSVSISGGSNTIKIVATDNPGNSTTSSRTVTRATAGPSLAISSPAVGAVINAATTNVSGTVSDSVSPVSSVTVNGVSASISGSSWSATVSLSEGTNSLKAVAKNQVGLSTTVTRNVIRDTTKPTLSVSAPADNLVTASSSVNVTGTVSDAHAVTVKVNDTAVTVSGGSFSKSVDLAGGTNTITVNATDSVGNTSTVTRTVKRATSGPALTITSPSDGFVVNNSGMVVSGTVSDSIADVKSVVVNGQNATISGNTWSVSVVLQEGSNSIEAIASNSVDLTTKKTVTGTLDTILSSISISSPETGQMVSDPTFTVTGTVSDSGSGIASVTVNGLAATVSGGLITGITFSRTITLAEGANAITAAVTDNAGNTAYAYGSVLLDTIPPSLTVTTPVDGLITNQTQLVVFGSVSDSGSGIKTLRVNNLPATVREDGTYIWLMSLREGLNEITVTAVDNVGLSTTITRTVRLDTQKPIITLISPAEGWLTTNRPTFVFEIADNEGGSGVDLLDATVSLDGAPQIAGINVSGGRLSFTSPSPLPEGQHVITVSAADLAGNQRGLSVTYGIDTLPPQMELTLPNSHRIVDTETILVSGVAVDAGSGVASVVAGGVTGIPAADGLFAIQAPLKVGLNEITVTATDHAGLSTTQTMQILRLVTDRNRQDIEAILDLCERGYANWTAEERAWWATTGSRRGSYDAQDLDRVNLAMEWLVTWLRDYGYLPVCDPDSRDWTDQDVFDLNDETKLVRNTAGLRAVLPLDPDVPETPPFVRDIGQANDVETILVAVDAVRPLIDVSAWYSGEISCGEF